MRSTLRLLHRGPPPPTPVTAAAQRRVSGPPSFAVCPRPQDLGRAWPVHARRCRALLPARLAWAAPALDPEHPVPVLCDHARAVALLRWHHHLPSWAHVSLGCRHTRTRR